MCLAVKSQIYWDVEVIVIGEVDGCTSIYELFEDDGSGERICRGQVLPITFMSVDCRGAAI